MLSLHFLLFDFVVSGLVSSQQAKKLQQTAKNTLICQILSGSVYFVAAKRQKNKILAYFQLQHPVLVPLVAETKLNECITTNLHLSKDIKTTSKVLMHQGEVILSNCIIQQRDKWTCTHKL